MRGDGIGTFTFGAKQVDVAAVLNDRLGYPDKHKQRQGILCPRDGNHWGQTEHYPGLVVYYTAKDQSRWSPRYLVAWVLYLDQVPAALTLQDDVPLHLTFNQLKAKYPAGKLVNPSDGGREFTLPNKLKFVTNPAGSKPGVVIAGQEAPCLGAGPALAYPADDPRRRPWCYRPWRRTGENLPKLEQQAMTEILIGDLP